ncbi:phosphoglycerate mutase [Serinicoccus sp. CUA-874]|uniref:histidine phosphatase family protein n=1 Tax=Serinicoccus sp. CUA-874 TaxID=1517939 RepID=UPI00095D4B0E|nr:histidine phosphatase family protein [Serinicoccus sp. CUA-874]OLT15954.1 phosphoglycerate mutase [Serinicoccus sp. CUA-874]
MSDTTPEIPGPAIPPHQLILIRHGETEWSKSGQHTGLTDLPLLPEGEEAAAGLQQVLGDRSFSHVRCSPLQRARRTAELAGLSIDEIDEDLREWDYGGYEGRSTPEIRSELGYRWNVFHHQIVPGDTPGETVEQVAARASVVLERIWPHLFDGDVALVGHGHALRILASVYLRQAPRFGQHLTFQVGSVAILGHHREQPTVEAWNHR